ncbi:hypothetical protein LWC33_20525 [Pseudonocardia sp. RS11V-5]|uniref:hypothetical protein n=1 Tax=Pseudonocardia terrae TaxID=2905831 RepID=UPI001E2C17C5|nr:hypothetical protein [Pseudonocardia terrae]MCE3553829.1 hypothetical protein [Pseudonocardia terrae]
MRNAVAVATAGALALVVVAAAVAAWLIGGRAFEAGAPMDAPVPVPGTGAGSATVELSLDALGHPQHLAVRERLQAYFDAINAHDHAAWAATVTPERVAAQPAETWLAGVRSTQDGTIRVDRIEDAPDGVRALVRFTSTQDVADAPADLKVGRICWRSALPMTGPGLAIGAGVPGGTLSQPC